MYRVITIIKKLEKELTNMEVKNHMIGTAFSDPYKILIAAVLSSRTRDEVTCLASKRLFSVADSPQEVVKLSRRRIAGLISKVGFYNRKSRDVLNISRILIRDFSSKVPRNPDELAGLPGVGRKTSNLVLSLAYGKPFICVDTHVHRIFNRLGIVDTKTPLETERTLQSLVPRKYWSRINPVFVLFGQNICRPLSPYCSNCKLKDLCKQRGVKHTR